MIRNPFEQVLSFYHHLRKPLYLSTEQLEHDYPGYDGKLLPKWASSIAMDNDFSAYVHYVYSDCNSSLPQSRWFRDLTSWFAWADGSVASIRVIRYESFKTDLASFFDDKGITGDIQWIGASSRLGLTSSYRDFYCSSAKAIIERRFLRTLTMFDYCW